MKKFKLHERVYVPDLNQYGIITEVYGNDFYGIQLDDNDHARSGGRWIEHTDLMDESIEEDDDEDHLYNEWTSKKQLELSSKKDRKFYVCVGHNEGPEAHFHLFKSIPDKDDWARGVILCIKKNEFFSHGYNTEPLKDSELVILKEKLAEKDKFENEQKTYRWTLWKQIIDRWNKENNLKLGKIGYVPLNQSIPDYGPNTKLYNSK